MSALVLDAGALVAVDRGDRQMIARLRVAHSDGFDLRTTGVVVAEAWRNTAGRQARLARVLRAVDVKAVDLELGRRAGALLDLNHSDDPVDATVVCAANSGDRILTGDRDDISRLVSASGRSILVIGC
ncbi:MAG: twitching motility protein PilT [Candidatus Dormiibacterota bacterium]